MHVATVVVAVTGSNGKTTTRCMIDHILRNSFTGQQAPKNFNNHIGVPLTLLSADADDRYLIVEIGTNTPGEVASLAAMASPDAAVITSIGEVHLEGLGSIDGVAAEKASLFRFVRPDGLAVVNIDRPEINRYLWNRKQMSNVECRMSNEYPRSIFDIRHSTFDIRQSPPGRRPRLVTLGSDPGARLCVADARGDIQTTTFELDGRYRIELPMPGRHHAANAAAAFAIARWFGVAPEEIIDRLQSFTPPEGRTRLCKIGGLTVVDDAYNANPASMAAAVETLRCGATGRRVFVMGDMLELGPGNASFHHHAVRMALEAGIEVLVAVGPAMAEAVRSIKPPVGPTGRVGWAMPATQQVVLCDDADAASDALMTILTVGDTVWVKGSRAVGLDRVVSALRSRFPQPAAVA